MLLQPSEGKESCQSPSAIQATHLSLFCSDRGPYWQGPLSPSRCTSSSNRRAFDKETKHRCLLSFSLGSSSSESSLSPVMIILSYLWWLYSLLFVSIAFHRTRSTLVPAFLLSRLDMIVGLLTLQVFTCAMVGLAKGPLTSSSTCRRILIFQQYS